MKHQLLLLSRLLALPLWAVVVVYQKTLSPDHGLLRGRYPQGYCRYHPSCSVYARQGLQQDGLVAVPKIIWRVVRCQPWSLGGIDWYSH